MTKANSNIQSFTSDDQVKLIDELYHQSYENDEGQPNVFTLLKVPSYMDEHCIAYKKLMDALDEIFPGSSENQPYEECICRFEDTVSKVSFRAGFLCALALNKVTRIE